MDSKEIDTSRLDRHYWDTVIFKQMIDVAQSVKNLEDPFKHHNSDNDNKAEILSTYFKDTPIPFSRG